MQCHALGLVLILCGSGNALADPPADTEPAAAASPSSDAQASPPKGDFFSSVKQAFKQDFDHEVVRGHFEVGAPPDAHRYYCLIDAKTGNSEDNGVGGQPFLRPDGMTGIKGGAVSFYNCAAAEKQGILVTTGYVLSASASAKINANARPAPAPNASGSSDSTPVPSVPPAKIQAEAPGASNSGNVQAEVMAVYTRFIAGQNAHDRAAVSDVLLDSNDFVWAQYGGQSIWGHRQAMEAFQDDWKGTWKLDVPPKEFHIASVAPGVAILITPLLFTSGLAGEEVSTVAIRWGGVFVKTGAGWRIASIFITPFKSWQPAH